MFKKTHILSLISYIWKEVKSGLWVEIWFCFLWDYKELFGWFFFIITLMNFISLSPENSKLTIFIIYFSQYKRVSNILITINYEFIISSSKIVKFVTSWELCAKKLRYIEMTEIHLIFRYTTRFSREWQFHSLYLEMTVLLIYDKY